MTWLNGLVYRCACGGLFVKNFSFEFRCVVYLALATMVLYFSFWLLAITPPAPKFVGFPTFPISIFIVSRCIAIVRLTLGFCPSGFGFAFSVFFLGLQEETCFGYSSVWHIFWHPQVSNKVKASWLLHIRYPQFNSVLGHPFHLRPKFTGIS